jgi:hypothetical protein
MISIEFTIEPIEAFHHQRSHHPHPRVQEKMEAVYLKSQGLPHNRQPSDSGRVKYKPRSLLRRLDLGFATNIVTIIPDLTISID